MRQSTLSPGLISPGPLDTDSPVLDAPPNLQPKPPRWVEDAMPNPSVCEVGSSVHASRSGSLVLLTTTVSNAGGLDADALREAVTQTYVAIGAALKSVQSKAIRLWNYLPDPGCLMAPDLDRYMVFNAGRRDGYRAWFSDTCSFETSLATASAVGIDGDDLVVQCLASSTDGRAVENPRQKSAWQYSTRYGPTPPSFSRATIASVGDRRLLLIGGTASVVGEDSMHIGDLPAQLDETLHNLATVVAAARGHSESSSVSLARLTDVRVYLSREQDARTVHAALKSRWRQARMEMAVARLCRQELLVEIEGVAEIEAVRGIRS